MIGTVTFLTFRERGEHEDRKIKGESKKLDKRMRGRGKRAGMRISEEGL